MKNFTSTIMSIALLPVLGHSALAQPAAPGNAIQLYGSSGFVNTTTSFSSPQAFTVSVWFNTMTTRGGRLVGFGNSQMGLSSYFDRHLYMDDKGHINFGTYTSNFQTVGSPAACNDGRWHQAVGTFSAATGMSLYIDGVLATNNPSFNADQSYTGWWKMGWDSLNGWPNAPTSYFFQGTIDEVQIWNTALTAGQVQYNLHRILTGTESGLVSYWHFNEGSGDTAADATGNGNTGVLNGAVDWVTSTAPVSGAFTILHTYNGSDGSSPQAGLIITNNTLYGTAYQGGVNGTGEVFALDTNGTDFMDVHAFSGNNFPPYTNSDGADPHGALVLSGDTLYGTAYQGGAYNNGAVFAVNKDGTDFTDLYDFPATSASNANSTGAGPDSVLILSGDTLYGTTSYGGAGGDGSVFAINIDGTSFTNLHVFSAISFNAPYANTDGAAPGNLVISGHTLYGTTSGGGAYGNGTVFAVNTDGTGFTNLYSFSAAYYPDYTNGDGAHPDNLILSGHTLYGTAAAGGPYNNGTVFAIDTDGTGFANLYTFIGAADGSAPTEGLILSNGTLYGTANGAGVYASGTVFAINTNGTGFTNLYSFTDGGDGAGPLAGLILSSNTLYGTTSAGGANKDGVVFALALGSAPAPIPLNIQAGNQAVILTWSNPAFSLQTAPAPNGVFTNVPGAVSPYTSAITGASRFFRLRAN